MIARLLCRIGLHVWRTEKNLPLPPVPPQFPNPIFTKVRCSRCAAKDWRFHA